MTFDFVVSVRFKKGYACFREQNIRQKGKKEQERAMAAAVAALALVVAYHGERPEGAEAAWQLSSTAAGLLWPRWLSGACAPSVLPPVGGRLGAVERASTRGAKGMARPRAVLWLTTKPPGTRPFSLTAKLVLGSLA